MVEPSPLGPLLVLLLAQAVASQAPQPPARRLEGIVLDPLSQAVANARITVEVDGDEIAHTHSDASGTFVFGKVPAKALTVRATTAVPDVGAVAIDLTNEPRGFACIRTMPARKVTGTVKDDAGKAIGGAWIACVPTRLAELGCVGSHTTSDAEGRFVLTHVPFGRIALRAWAAGLAGFAADVNDTADADVACVLMHDDLQERTFELADATAEQRATARFRVTVTADDAVLLLPPTLRAITPDANGVWQVTGWPHDDVMVARVEIANGFVDAAHLAAGIGNRTKRLRVDDPEEGIVHGKLTSAEGLPVGGVRLLARATFDAAAPQTSVTTEPDGTFALPSPVSRGSGFALRCADPGLALLGTNDDAGDGELLRSRARGMHTKAKVQEFVLVRGHTVRLQLRDADGQPFPGADIALLGTRLTEVTRGSPNGPSFACKDAPVFARGRSAIDGSVMITGLDLREGEGVVCQAAGSRGFLQQEFVVGKDLVCELGELRAGPSPKLLGHTLTPDGKPLAGARITVQNWCGGERTQVAASDRDGTFLLLGLMPGPCIVAVLATRPNGELVRLVQGETAEVTVQQPAPRAAKAR